MNDIFCIVVRSNACFKLSVYMNERVKWTVNGKDMVNWCEYTRHL